MTDKLNDIRLALEETFGNASPALVGFQTCHDELWPVIESLIAALERLCLVGPPNMYSDGENISRGQLHDNCEIAEAALADAKEKLGL